MKSGIYQIENVVNNKVYIGSTNNFNRRKNFHYCRLNINKHSNKHLQQSFNKYGIENLKFSIIEYCAIDLLLERENFWITFKQSINPNYGYNLITTDKNGRSEVRQETRDKLSMINKGKPLSEETIRKQREGRIRAFNERGFWITEEHRDRISKPVLQYDLNGNFIKEYRSIKEAAKENNCSSAGILQICKGSRKKPRYFIWKYRIKN